MKQGNIKFEFELKASGGGLFLSSPDLNLFSFYVQGGEQQEHKKNILKHLPPVLEAYLRQYYDINIERCLLDLKSENESFEAGQKFDCIVVPKKSAPQP